MPEHHEHCDLTGSPAQLPKGLSRALSQDQGRVLPGNRNRTLPLSYALSVGIKRADEVLISTKFTVVEPDLTVRIREAEVKGDVAGHAFHGNRFTGGIGGGERPMNSLPRKIFENLKGRWALVNNDLLKYVNTPNDPKAIADLKELRDLSKTMNNLPADPGGPGGVGLPGGPRDLVAIGAGPGGLSAAISGRADGLDVLVLEADSHVGGQSAHSSRIENYPGFPAGVSGETLAGTMYDQATRLGAEVRTGVTVTGISYDAETDMKTLTLSTGETIDTRAVVLAGGVASRTLDFPGSDSPNIVYGDAGKMSELAGEHDALVIGGSNGAAQAALGAAEQGQNVTILSRSDIAKGMSDYQVSAIENNPRINVVQGDEIASYKDGVVTTRDGATIPNIGAIGVFAGGAPASDWLPTDIGRTGRAVTVDGNLQTTMPGVYAVGDIRTGAPQRILGAAADGQIAERNLQQYLYTRASASKGAAVRGRVLPAYDPERMKMNRTTDALYDLDIAFPYFAQTVEPDVEVVPSAGSKGDVAGHAFHGNRYTGGLGSATKPLSHLQWRNLINSFKHPDEEAVNVDARNAYHSEIAPPEDPLDGKEFESVEEAQQYLNTLAEKYTPGTKVVATTMPDFFGAAGQTDPNLRRDNYFRISFGDSYLNQRVALHEFAHVLGAERSGIEGHGASFRQAYLDLIGAERPQDFAQLRQNYSDAGPAMGKGQAGVEYMGGVVGSTGAVLCVGKIK